MVSPITPTGTRQEGFTLLEILVAIMLVSLVIVIAAMALRLTIRAWERGRQEGEVVQIRAMIPSILKTQLKCIIKNTRFSPTGKEIPLPFYGQEHAVSFFTSYAPRGSRFQGVLRVSFVFRKRDETLLLYQQSITNQADLEDSFSPLSENWNDSIKPAGEIKGVGAFDLIYSGKRAIDYEEMDQWKKEWDADRHMPPAYIRLVFAAGEKEKPLRWFFAVGQ